MHCSVRYILGLAAVLGTFPVTNITSSSTRRLRFRWLSPVTVYTMVLLLGFVTVELISIDYTIQHLNQANLTVAGGFKRATSGTIFYGNACIGIYLFLSLAKAWPDLANKWRTVELSMKIYGQPRLFLRFITIATVFMSLAFMENGLHNWLSVQTVFSAYDNETIYFVDYLRIFALNSHWYLFEDHSYTTWRGLATVWISLSGTFIWNFIDLFIMLVSSALAAQFNVLNRALRAIRGKILTQLEWREYREMYASLTHLVKLVDHHINRIIVLSVTNNVYFICAQLITEIDSGQSDYKSQLFYVYSVLFLVGRTTAVVILAAAIHDESRLVAPELFLCPPESYCTEVQRFLQEVTSDYVALTGLNMFAITRNFLLGIAGAILTYEIVLIQLQNSNRSVPGG
ncbi:gustatory receptor for sugar taste 64f-like [Macrosteles quadrilineatus]|uniref:gustatory receptor for sugar taste 64f-like n=1 Tax=Macrosteles quadrilineatus TaxID=74068 RepID=UPI0023E11D1F|nr:gustatory receptor for sugar taste 64f-like [Macrosteles quadrilineatus]